MNVRVCVYVNVQHLHHSVSKLSTIYLSKNKKFRRVLVPVLFGEFSHPTLQTCDTVMAFAIDILAEGP
jgi:hypothetical protein